MYNLLVSGLADRWTGTSASMPLDRFGEHTSETFRKQYREFSPSAIADLTSFPTLFAYETARGQKARLGRITRIAQPSGQDIRFDFSFVPDAKPITPARLLELSWELDLQEWEMNRTHWAIKDVDLEAVLRKAKVLPTSAVPAKAKPALATQTPPPVPLQIHPTVFALPTDPVDTKLVAVMMPFSRALDGTYTAIEKACAGIGLHCQRADRIWEDQTIIQDIFRLIWRSTVVVADLTRTNPNVLYEVGIAHTLGRLVVPIAQNPLKRPFDIAHHRILSYTNTPAGLRALRKALAERLSYLAA